MGHLRAAPLFMSMLFGAPRAPGEAV